jgi:ABC-type transport system involved in cytochrome bd biosynthesis fused ATPase/permease subunit
MAETVQQYISDEEVLGRIEDAGEKARVSPLDPDFLCFALPVAMIFDAIDIVLELTSILVVPKLVGMAMDVFTFAVIGGWIFYRTGKIIKSREEQKKALLKRIGKQRMGLKKQLAKGLKSPLRRTLARAGIALLGELAPLVGLVPFWSISVILTLREK